MRTVVVIVADILGKGTPDRRIRSVPAGRILSYERLGGLHHRYDRAA
jgi:hypothetical protein